MHKSKEFISNKTKTCFAHKFKLDTPEDAVYR